jgi:iron-sulfur cluster binding protein, putative
MGTGGPRAASTPEAITSAIKREAHRLGFDDVGIAPATAAAEDEANLTTYLADGRHGAMAWMETTRDRRADPQALWSDARSIVCCAMNYGPAANPLTERVPPGCGAISVYARGRDYHDVMKKRLKALGRWVAATYGCEVKVFVDTAPVMEKPLAQRAGLGWIGKHTNLVSRRFGSWLFLGEVFTTLDLPPDQPETDHCGSCDRCRQACPTAALPEPYRIEPRRCVSYLTIEHKGELPPDLAVRMGNRIYGCDDCLAVCPWNSFATPTVHPDLAPRPEAIAPRLADLLALDDRQFRARFAGTAIKRIGVARLQRNVRSAASTREPDAADAIASRNSPPR